MIGRHPLNLTAKLLRDHRPFSLRMESSLVKGKGPSSSTVAACIIANEVLNGKTLDTNSHYLGKTLSENC